MSSSTERIQDSTAAVKRLATKYNCDIVGRNLADNLVEIKRKNKRALDDLKLHCEVSLARNDDKLARPTGGLTTLRTLRDPQL